jgi:hypothetical protein
MSTLRLHSIFTLLILAACSAPGRTATPMSGSGDDDAIRLTSGDVIRGRILEENGRQVVIERESVVSTYPRGSIYGIDYSKERWHERKQALHAPEPRRRRPAPRRPGCRGPIRASRCSRTRSVPRHHGPADCIGPALTRAHQELPDLRLFVEPGGKTRAARSQASGATTPTSPSGALRIPSGKAGLTIDLAEDEGALARDGRRS